MQWRGPGGSGELTIGEELGKGGEGSVYSLSTATGIDPSTRVAKIYHDSTGRLEKLVEMLKNPVNNQHIAWPEALVLEDGEFKGYIMTKLDYDSYRPWSEVAHSSTRRANASSFDYQYALYSALNLSYLLDSVHQVGHKIGDLNESNVLVGVDSTVSLVDTDSAQVGDHLCLVGKPEYTAPEIVGNFADNPRTIETDLYAYGVLVWQILTGGTHPTDGEWVDIGEPPTVTERIRRGDYPALGGNESYRSLPRVPTEAVSVNIRQGIWKLLSLNPNHRGSAEDFRKVIEAEISLLQQCNKVSSHWYSGESCSWCERVSLGLNDPWGDSNAETVSQKSLPSIDFNSLEDFSPAPRIALKTESSAPSLPPIQSTYPSNSAQGYSQSPHYTQGHSYPSSPSVPPSVIYVADPPPEPEEIPDKINGKCVLTYADGSWDVRPPLSVVARSNFKLAVSCFFSEIPKPLKFWWAKNSKPSPLWSLIVGGVLGLLISVSWKFISVIDDSFFPEFIYLLNPFKWLALSSVVTSTVFVTSLLITGLLYSFRNRGLVKDSWYKVLGRFLVISLFYGPLFVVITVITLIYLLVLLIVSIVTA